MATILFAPFQGFDGSGEPLSAGKVYSYAAGTTSAKALYSDAALTTPLSNPATLDSAGRLVAYLNGSYYLELKTSADTLIDTYDEVAGGVSEGLFEVEHDSNGKHVFPGTRTPGDILIDTGTDIGRVSPVDGRYLKSTSATPLWDFVTTGDISGISTYWEGVLDETSYANALSAIGFSSWGRSWNQLDGSASALTALGVTAFGSALVHDPTSASARVTLGVDPKGFYLLDGMNPAYVSTSEVTLSSGVCQDSDNADYIKFQTAKTVSISGAGAGGLDTGSVAASTWYYLWAIGKTDGTTAGMFSLSSTSPTMPSGYTLKRLVAAARTNASSQIVSTSLAASGPRGAFPNTVMLVQNIQSNGTGGGSVTADTYVKYAFNTVVASNLPGSSLGTSGAVTLQAGTYCFDGELSAYGMVYANADLYDTTSAAQIAMIRNADNDGGQPYIAYSYGPYLLKQQKTLNVRFYSSFSVSGNGQGRASSYNNGNEYYGWLKVTRLEVNP